MDLTKLQGSSFNKSGLFGESAEVETESAIEKFLNDTNEQQLTSSVGDLLNATRSRHDRQFGVSERGTKLLAGSSSTPALGTRGETPGTGGLSQRPGTGNSTRGKARKEAVSRGSTKPFDMVLEQPASRVDIVNLERELEVRVKAIVAFDSMDVDNPSDLADSRKDGVIIVRNQLLDDFGADMSALEKEPWLDTLIKCQCVKVTCDDVAKKLTNMLNVSSVELGNVLKKLRLAYTQSFDQMRESWLGLRGIFLDYEEQLNYNRKEFLRISAEIGDKEDTVRDEMQMKINELTQTFNDEKRNLTEALEERDEKINTMGTTLNSLNGIFKTMQNDSTALKAQDTAMEVQRLQQENTDLTEKALKVEKLQSELEVALERIDVLERENKAANFDLKNVKEQLVRREESVVALMERESLRNAEIEKMKDITGVQDDTDFGIDFKEPATSVLCIKCKKSLDDLSNIRSAILNRTEKTKIQCENFRILLPNLRGRRPPRSQEWIRHCMRSIIVSKMREDVSLLDFKGERNNFSSYVYSWFSRSPDYELGEDAIKAQQNADEDRWGLYYGVKAMVRENDPEATMFWLLLEEESGEDGMQFMFHCLSMALSMGGMDLWKQFGDTLTSESVACKVKSESKPDIRLNIWLDVGSAVEALKCILVRALKPHVQEAVDAIYAFRVLPHIADPQLAEMMTDEEKADLEEEMLKKQKKDTEEAEALAAAEAAKVAEDGEGGEGDASVADGSVEEKKEEPESGADSNTDQQTIQPTHVNLFVWLRLMMQQMQAEQIHRAAAIRLMCESASVGALTPQLSTVGDENDLGSKGSQVEYPQFTVIAKTLFPGISDLECSSLFIHCYDEGRRKVTAEVLLKIADRRGLFSKSMRLSVLPILRQHIKAFNIEVIKTVTDDKGALLTGEGATSEEKAALQEEKAKEEAEQTEDVQQETETTEDLPESLADLERSAVEKMNSQVDDAAPDESSVGSIGSQSSFRRVKTMTVEPAGPMHGNEKLRSLLGVLIHRKLAALMPDFELLCLRVPDRWRGLLQETRDDVIHALNDGFDKMKKGKLEDNKEKNKFLRKREHFIDGIQPYVQYRRLLTTMLWVKSFSENPLLPAELFLGKENPDRTVLPNFDFGFTHLESLLTSLEKSIVTGLRLDGVNTSHESTTKSLITTTVISEKLARSFYGDLGTSKVFRFEAVRRNICARRIQFWKNRYFDGSKAYVPSSIRITMRAGYLRNMHNSMMKRRFNKPLWWVQTLISDVYAYKLKHDRHAAPIGDKSLPLSQSITAYCTSKYGVTDMAERDVHDLFYNIHLYGNDCSRIKLFACLLGFKLRNLGQEAIEEAAAREAAEAAKNKNKNKNDDSIPTKPVVVEVEEKSPETLQQEANESATRKILQSNLAASMYFNLIIEIHRQRLGETVLGSESPMSNKPGTFLKKIGVLASDDDGAEGPGVAYKSTASSQAVPGNPLLAPAIVKEEDTESKVERTAEATEGEAEKKEGEQVGAEDESKAETTKKADTFEIGPSLQPAPVYIPVIEVLFPSSNIPSSSSDGNDEWFLAPDVLVNAVLRWSQGIKGLDKDTQMQFADIVETLKTTTNDLEGRINVDDFLYVVMQKWGKLMAYQLNRAALKVAHTLKNCVESRIPPALLQELNKQKNDDDLGSAKGDWESVADSLKRPTLSTRKKPVRPALWNGTYLKAAVENVYKANSGEVLLKPNIDYLTLNYLNKASASTLIAHTTEAMLHILQSCSLWDTHLGFGYNGLDKDNLNHIDKKLGNMSLRATNMLYCGDIIRGSAAMNSTARLSLMRDNYMESIEMFLYRKIAFMKSDKKYQTILKKRLETAAISLSKMRDAILTSDNEHKSWSIMNDLLCQIDDIIVTSKPFDSDSNNNEFPEESLL